MSYYQKECPNCAEMIGINAAKCPHCDFVLEKPTSQSAETEPWSTYAITETESGQSFLAYRLAAVILFLVAFINILTILQGLIQYGAPDVTRIVSVFVDIALGVGLLQFRPGARTVVLLRVTLGAIAFPCLAFNSGDAITAVIFTVIQVSFFGALVLLLTGESKTWRLILAGALFGLFTLIPSVLLLLLSILMIIFQ